MPTEIEQAAAKTLIETRCSNPYLLPDGTLIRCNSRSKQKCPACSELTRGDWLAILRSGIYDAAEAEFVFVLLTVTAPSFGKTHRVPKGNSNVVHCSCGKIHNPETDLALRGLPVNISEYDYDTAVLWNHSFGKLWNNLLRSLRRLHPGLAYALVREWQTRGALHGHVILRIPKDQFHGIEVIADMVPTITTNMAGRILRFGTQVDCQVINTANEDDSKTVNYLTKAIQYLAKDIGENTGDATSSYRRLHRLRLHEAAWRMRCHKCPEPGPNALACRSRCHKNWGATGQVVQVSDNRGRGNNDRPAWSLTGLTRTSLRIRRVEWARANINTDQDNNNYLATAIQAKQLLDPTPSLEQLRLKYAKPGMTDAW